MIQASRRSTGYVIRGYAAPGLYWREPLTTHHAAYVPQDDLIFTVCQIEPDRHPEAPYSEFDQPYVEEFRLLAALALAVNYDDGLIRPQPLSSSLVVGGALDFGRPETLERVRAALIQHWRQDRPPTFEGRYPPYTPGGYDFRSDTAPIALQKRILASIDLDDHLLTRGLRTLLRAVMLAAHPMYAEEAVYPLHVALDASHSLFKRQMEAEGLSNVSTMDIAERFETLFGEPRSGEAYFADYYVDRIMAQHPMSRHGVAPYIPTTHGEVLWLYKALREIFRYFVLGEVVDPSSA